MAPPLRWLAGLVGAADGFYGGTNGDVALDTMPGETIPEGVVPEGAASRPDRHPGSDSPRVVSSDMLLAGRSQLAILHNETIYFLRQTRFGKLILTK